MATIVALHAHPDDEALLTGGWLAQRAAAGDRLVVVFATDGDAGLAAPSNSARPLGNVRRHEAATAARALGVSRLVWLGYADSGTADSPSTGTHRLVDVPVVQAARAVADVLDQENADTLTGYDANGGYGHPDHVRVHHVARAAQQLARTRPVLLEATMDRTLLLPVLRIVRPFTGLHPGLTIPGNDIYTARRRISMRVDVRRDVPAKRRALAAHRSQAEGGIRTIGMLLKLPRPLAQRLLGTEWFNRHE